MKKPALFQEPVSSTIVVDAGVVASFFMSTQRGGFAQIHQLQSGALMP
jgi:hypothetical protein